MPRDQPAGTSFLQAVLWIVWEMRALRATVEDTGEYIGNQLNAIGVSALDEVQLTRRWGQIRTELQDSAVEVLREDLARVGVGSGGDGDDGGGKRAGRGDAGGGAGCGCRSGGEEGRRGGGEGGAGAGTRGTSSAREVRI